MKLLKAVAIEISTPLAHIFNLSLKKAIYPDSLKLCRIVPIHKGGKSEFCDNYRPIALLSSFSKILEKIVSLKLENHLEYHKLLSPRQFGSVFRIRIQGCLDPDSKSGSGSRSFKMITMTTTTMTMTTMTMTTMTMTTITLTMTMTA